MPEKLYRHTSTFYQNCIYVFGGNETNKFYKYDIKKQNWTAPSIANEKPNPRYDHSASLLDNKLYIIGGEWVQNTKIHQLDFQKQSWKSIITKGQIPEKRQGHSADVYNKQIMIFGGFDFYDGIHSNDLYILDIDDQYTFSLIDPQGKRPERRYRHGSCIIKNNLYIFGGYNDVKFFDDMFYYNITKNEWNTIQINNRPSPRTVDKQMIASKDQIYLFGGYSGRNKWLNDFWVFDIQNNQWKLENEIFDFEGREAATLTLFDGIFYLIGGYNSSYKILDEIIAIK